MPKEKVVLNKNLAKSIEQTAYHFGMNNCQNGKIICHPKKEMRYCRDLKK
jgi:hypothetical protein